MFAFFPLWQVENLQQENASLKKQVQKVKEQFLQQKVSKTNYFKEIKSKIYFFLWRRYVLLRVL